MHLKPEEQREPIFFKSQSGLRNWFEKNSSTENELWLGYYKKSTGKASITWSQSVDEAICFGWIDGIRKSIDDECYMIRFTPRNPKSHWSAVNIQKAERMIASGHMKQAGLEIYSHRDEKKSRMASYEQTSVRLDERYEKQIRNNGAAWEYYESLPPSVKKTSIHWIMSAKHEETRLRRLSILIQSSKNKLRIPPLRR